MKKRRFIYLVIIFCFVFNLIPFPNVYGDGESITVLTIENDTYGDVGAGANTKIDVNGSVYGSVSAAGENSSLNVKGDVYLDNNRQINSSNSGSINVEGNVVASSEENTTFMATHDNAQIVVNGTVTGNSILISDNSHITLNGGTVSSIMLDIGQTPENSGSSISGSINIVSNGNQTSALSTSFNSEADLTGNITNNNENGTGIAASNNSTVHLSGDINTSESGSPINASTGATVVVEGAVNGGRIDAYDENTHVSVESGTVNYVMVLDNANLTGQLNIDAKDNSLGLFASDNGNVDIIGDITNNNENGTAIASTDGASVKVEGNITSSQNIAIEARNNASVDITGNVIGEIYTRNELPTDSTSVNVTGNLTGDISSNDGNTSIEISGNVDGDIRSFGDNSSIVVGAINGNIFADGNSSVTVNSGNVNSASISGGATVTVEDKIEGPVSITGKKSTLIGATGIDSSYSGLTVDDNASVHIQGDVRTDYGYAVTATNNSDVNVNGDVKNETEGYAVFASNSSDIIVNGNVVGTITAINAQESSIVTVKKSVSGNIDASGGSTVAVSENVTGSVKASGEETTVNIDGTLDGVIIASGDGTTITAAKGDVGNVSVTEGATVNINGVINGLANISGEESSLNGAKGVNSSGLGLQANNGASVHIEGDVSAQKLYAVIAANDSEIEIDGDVHNDNPDDGRAIIAISDAEVTVGGNVSGATNAIKTLDDGTVNVDGNVTAGETGIIASDGGSVNIKGNVTSDDIGIQVTIGNITGDAQSTVVVNGTVDGANKAVELAVGEGIDTDAVISALPQIIVQSLETEGDMVVVTSQSENVDQSAVTEALISQIHYIVNQEGIDSANISVFGTEKKSTNGNDYVVAKETSKITLKSTNDGYVVCSVSAGKYATIEENEDGSYTITVERGGDLNLVASVKEKPAENDDSDNNQGDDGSTTGDNGNVQNQGGNTSDDTGNGQNQGDNGNGDSPSVPGNPAKPDWPHDNGNHWGRPNHPYNPWQNTGNNQGNNGRPQNAYSDYLLMPDYSSMILTINLVGRNRSTVLRTDLEVFQKAGFATVNIVTEDASLFMAMANLLELYGGSSRCTFVRNGNTVELWVRDALVVTVTLVKKDPIAA